MKKSLTLILILLLVILSANVLFYYIYFPGSTLNGELVSWSKRPDARVEALDEQLFFVSDKAGINQEITPKGFFSYAYELPEKELFTLRPLHQETSKALRYDEAKLKEYVQAAHQHLPENQAARNASLSLKEGEIHLEPSKTEIAIPDAETLYTRAQEALQDNVFSISLDEYIHEPEVPSRELRSEANRWKKYRLLCKDYEWTLDGKDYLSLFKEDFSLDKEKAEEVFTAYFDQADQGKTMWVVDQEDSLPTFLQALEEKKSTWEPSYERVVRSPDPGYTMGDGIAVSLDRQWLWLFRGGSVVFQAPVITGNPNKGYATHRGNWSILEMNTNTRLANTNREGYSYDVPVSYWMQINTMGMIEGIHDATWHWAFGTDHYLYDGSHGCINLHPSDMATLYYQCWVGMPVWVY